MAPPTLACDGPREDSIEFVPVLFVAITRRNVASLDQETRVGEQMFGLRSPGGGAPAQLADSGGALPRGRRLNTERRAMTAARPQVERILDFITSTVKEINSNASMYKHSCVMAD